MLFVFCFPLCLEEIFLTPVYHLAFVFCEFGLQTHFIRLLKGGKTKNKKHTNKIKRKAHIYLSSVLALCIFILFSVLK